MTEKANSTGLRLEELKEKHEEPRGWHRHKDGRYTRWSTGSSLLYKTSKLPRHRFASLVFTAPHASRENVCTPNQTGEIVIQWHWRNARIVYEDGVVLYT